MKLNISIKKILLVLPLIIIFIIDFFNVRLDILGYADELVTILYGLYILYNIVVYRDIELFKYISVLFIFVLIGLLGNIFSSFKLVGPYWIAIDIFIFIKPYIFLITGMCFFKKNPRLSFSKKTVDNIVKFLCVFVFAFGIFHCFFYKFNFYSLSRSNRYSFTTGFPGTLATYLFIFTILLIKHSVKYKKIYFFINFISILITTSAVGVLSMVLLFIFYFLYPKYRLKWYHLFFIGAIAILIGWNEINNYLMNTSTARSKMYVYSFATANHFFPFGSGFGTYGGYSAAYNYSFLYKLYNFNSVHGLGEDVVGSGSNFLFDTYYPMIIAQFGYIGMLLYLWFIIFTFNIFFRKKKYISLSLLLMILIYGIGFNFSSPTSCLLFFTAGFSFKNSMQKHIC